MSFIYPDLNEINLTDLPTELVPKVTSRLDNLKNVNNQFISHIEPNGYLTYKILGRMLRYRADIIEFMYNGYIKLE